MAKVCFVSYEIHPTVSGGCGVLLYNAARVLLAQGHEVIFLLDLANAPFKKFNTVDRLSLPNHDNCRAYQVETLVAEYRESPENFKSVYEYFAYRFHLAASKVNKLEQPDVIEFFEYLGVAYHALCAKAAGLDYQNTHLAVRIHSTMELIDRYQPGNIHTIDRDVMYNMERHALRLAETVLYPSQSFLDKAYKPFYEPWFGQEVLSPPPLVDRPSASITSDYRGIILYYGRLFGIKGVDRFVDAAVLYLSNPENPRREFTLVGYDSKLAPDGSGAYQDYLLQKIPDEFKSAFHFTGHMSWNEVGKILTRTRFAVIPSYLESFCYAAHELYEANVPLIVSDIPAFEDYFQHEENALVFDGSLIDLACQMERLSTDNKLLLKIQHPYTALGTPLGSYYETCKAESWIKPGTGKPASKVLICILCEQPDTLPPALNALKDAPSEQWEVVIARPKQEKDMGRVYTWFLGKLCAFEDAQGKPLYPTQVKTNEALLVLNASDLVDPQFLATALSTFARQPQISFVACWRRVQGRYKSTIEATCFDASPELLPLSNQRPLSRAVHRTAPGNFLIDLFDPMAGEYGEIAHLWQMDTDTECGITIPAPLVTVMPEKSTLLNTSALDYLFLRYLNHWRKSRLARYALTLENRAAALLKNQHQYVVKHDVAYFAHMGILWLGASKLNQWMNRIPGIKRFARSVAESLHLLEKKARE